MAEAETTKRVNLESTADLSAHHMGSARTATSTASLIERGAEEADKRGATPGAVGEDL